MIGKVGALAGAIWNRAQQTAAAAAIRVHVAIANTWRDQYNPLKGLNIRRAVSLLEAGERGAYAELQWTYRFIEMQDATLGALIERRTSAVQEMSWNINIREGLEEGSKEEALAEKQAELLKETYGRICNLKQAFETLVEASFRGFAHLEKVRVDDEIVELQPVEQWFWSRKGLNGPWLYDPKLGFGSISGEEWAPENLITREVARPINRVALVAYLRKNLSQKDWDGFIETYGIDPLFITLPPEVPADKVKDYQDSANAVVSNSRGVLPHGSEPKTINAGNRGSNPFKEHIDYQDAQMVLRGTGGKLTMLAESGSGTLAGNAHADTFEAIAKAEAAEISEILQKAIDEEVLNDAFPGAEHYAYFEIAANEETDTKQVVSDVAELQKAGYKVKADQIEEKTGYEFEEEEPEKDEKETEQLDEKEADDEEAEQLDEETPDDEAVRNRSTAESRTGFAGRVRALVAEAQQENFRGLGDLITDFLKRDDLDPIEAARELNELLPTMLEDTTKVEEAFEKALFSAFINGLDKQETADR